MKPKVHKYANGGMVKPEKAKGGPPKKIGHDYKNSPGGPYTPGAKAARKKKAREKKAREKPNP